MPGEESKQQQNARNRSRVITTHRLDSHSTKVINEQDILINEGVLLGEGNFAQAFKVQYTGNDEFIKHQFCQLVDGKHFLVMKIPKEILSKNTFIDFVNEYGYATALTRESLAKLENANEIPHALYLQIKISDSSKTTTNVFISRLEGYQFGNEFYSSNMETFLHDGVKKMRIIAEKDNVPLKESSQLFHDWDITMVNMLEHVVNSVIYLHHTSI